MNKITIYKMHHCDEPDCILNIDRRSTDKDAFNRNRNAVKSPSVRPDSFPSPGLFLIGEGPRPGNIVDLGGRRPFGHLPYEDTGSLLNLTRRQGPDSGNFLNPGRGRLLDTPPIAQGGRGRGSLLDPPSPPPPSRGTGRGLLVGSPALPKKIRHTFPTEEETVHDVHTDDKEAACVICTENKACCVALNCMHMNVCIGCARKLGKDIPIAKCPVCRKAMTEGMKRVFM